MVRGFSHFSQSIGKLAAFVAHNDLVFCIAYLRRVRYRSVAQVKARWR